MDLLPASLATPDLPYAASRLAQRQLIRLQRGLDLRFDRIGIGGVLQTHQQMVVTIFEPRNSAGIGALRHARSSYAESGGKRQRRQLNSVPAALAVKPLIRSISSRDNSCAPAIQCDQSSGCTVTGSAANS